MGPSPRPPLAIEGYGCCRGGKGKQLSLRLMTARVHEAPAHEQRKQVTVLLPSTEAHLVQPWQCRALIHSPVCRICTLPVQISNAFRGKLTDGHGENSQRFFLPSSVIIGYLWLSETTCIFSQASWLPIRTKCISLQWCWQHWAHFSLKASHLWARDCTVQKLSAMMPWRGDIAVMNNTQA